MFKSEVARFPTDKDNNPAVGSYRWSETATYRPRTLRFGAEKEESVRKQAEYIEKLIGKKLPSSIGPGSYEVAFKPFGRTFEMRPEPKARLEEPSKPVLV